VPLTASTELFATAAELGRTIIWLHSFGEQFTDTKRGRPARPPRLPKEVAPRIPADGAISQDTAEMPDSIAYDEVRHRLLIGHGYVEGVPRRSGTMRSPASRCCVNGSAIAGPIVRGRLSVIAGSHRSSERFSRTAGLQNTRRNSSTCSMYSAVSLSLNKHKPNYLSKSAPVRQSPLKSCMLLERLVCPLLRLLGQERLT
jgi:hypothetical protein